MNNLNARRKALGYTQQQLADMMCVSARTIQIWENGGNVPMFKRQFLTEKLGVTFDDEDTPSDMIADGDNNTQVRGDGNKVTTHSSSSLDKALDEIGEMRKALTEAMRANQEALRVNQENTSRLLGILENMSGKQESDR